MQFGHHHHEHLQYNHDRIHTVTNLQQGMVLMSNSGNYFARMQPDGNLAVYVSSHFVPSNIIWQSGSSGKGEAPYHLRMQDDGNLVIYDAHNHPTWASNTNNQGFAPWSLIMQDDGNLVVSDRDNFTTFSSYSAR